MRRVAAPDPWRVQPEDDRRGLFSLASITLLAGADLGGDITSAALPEDDIDVVLRNGALIPPPHMGTTCWISCTTSRRLEPFRRSG